MAHHAQLVSVCAAGFVSGYVLHSWLSHAPKKPRRAVVSDLDVSSAYTDSESEDDIDIDSTELNNVPGEVRMTLVVRLDLKMGKGKAAAQCSHATLALYKKMANPNSPAHNEHMLRRWEAGNGQAKITLQVPDQEAMDVLFAQAMLLGVNAYIVHDAGRTQIAAGSATVLGLGPAPKLVMDQITLELKLY